MPTSDYVSSVDRWVSEVMKDGLENLPEDLEAGNSIPIQSVPEEFLWRQEQYFADY